MANRSEALPRRHTTNFERTPRRLCNTKSRGDRLRGAEKKGEKPGRSGKEILKRPKPVNWLAREE